MKRRLFTILSALSLVLFVALVVLWVRSYSKWSYVRRLALSPDAKTEVVVGCATGIIYVALINSASDYGPRTVKYEWQDIPVDERTFGIGWRLGPTVEQQLKPHDGRRNHSGFTFLGVKWRHFEYKPWSEPKEVLRRVDLPFAWAVLLLAILPAAFVLRWRRSKRFASGIRCPSCGYDLRATPERCPECGAAPAKPYT